MFKTGLTILFLWIIETGLCQPVLQWAKIFEGVNPHGVDEMSNGRSIAVDADGNVYSVGLLANNVDFDPGPGTYFLSTPGIEGRGIYISKLSPDGEFIWARQILQAISFGTIEFTLDKDANVFLTAYFSDPLDMDPGPGTHILTPTSSTDAFVLKLDTDGNFVWAKQFGADHPFNSAVDGTAITTDAEGNLILCGSFIGKADLDPGVGTYFLHSDNKYSAYILKLNRDGDLIWANGFHNYAGTVGSSGITDVKVDPQGNIYSIGTFRGECDFDPRADTFYLRSSGSSDGFISKLSSDGNFIWAKHTGNLVNTNNYFVIPHGLELDSKNNVYISGTFIGPQDFDPGPGEFYMEGEAGYMDGYLLKLTGGGDFVWVKRFGGSDNDVGADLAIDPNGNIYFSGIFLGSVDFDPGPGQSIIEDLYDEFAIVKLNPDGQFIYIELPFVARNSTTVAPGGEW